MDQALRQFILEHSDDDIGKLLLGKGKWPGVDVPAAVNCIVSRRKLRDKVPSWYECESLLYPNTLSAEQCSSQQTALYKTRIALAGAGRRKPDGPVAIADLTGGLGVDSWHFALAGAKVLYNEMDPAIYESAVHNFGELSAFVGQSGAGCDSTLHETGQGADCSSTRPGLDILCRNYELRADNIGTVLDGFSPDLIFLDPARRSDSGGKVFRLEDCSPDLTKLAAPLLEYAPRVVAKLSPMADISLIVGQLDKAGAAVQAIHIVGTGGECKELLAVMGKPRGEELEIIVAEGEAEYRFCPSREAAAGFVPVPSEGGLEQKLLFEPGKALMKSGARNLLCLEGMQKFGRSTHLYLCDTLPERLEGLGKVYLIRKACGLDKRSMKAVAAENRCCEVTARNIPMTSDELRKRMGVASGGDTHVFGLKCDTRGNLLLVCSRLR